MRPDLPGRLATPAGQGQPRTDNRGVARVLLIEDDPAVREGLGIGLRDLGYRVAAAATGEDGLAQARAEKPDVVVLDVMLPGLDGFEVCRRLRAIGPVPIIMVTARGDDLDVVSGLEAGADDYVVKPVQPRVLDARIRAVLRRIDRQPTAQVEYGDLVIDHTELVVTRNGKVVDLSPTELRVLLVLSAAPGQVFSRQQLLRAVWDQDYLGDSRLVDSCVTRLRRKLEDDASDPVHLHTVRGFGYRFGGR
jgi:two-component system, OmpR family, response regulator MtrA